jgi:GxxExxY protein
LTTASFSAAIEAAAQKNETRTIAAKKRKRRKTQQPMKDITELCDKVRETAFGIHRYHKHGHLEKVYANAPAHRLRKLGLDARQQYPLTVYDEDGTVIGEQFADLFVDNRLIVELKAVKALADEHVAQLLGYLRASRIEHGLLMNFGAPRFKIRKYALSQNPRRRSQWQITQLAAFPLFPFCVSCAFSRLRIVRRGQIFAFCI